MQSFDSEKEGENKSDIKQLYTSGLELIKQKALQRVIGQEDLAPFLIRIIEITNISLFNSQATNGTVWIEEYLP